MIPPEERFSYYCAGYFGSEDWPKEETECSVWDWDQLRLIKMKGMNMIFDPEAERFHERRILAPIIDYLSPNVCAITVDEKGLISELSTDLEDDDSFFLAHHPFSTTTSLHKCRVI